MSYTLSYGKIWNTIKDYVYEGFAIGIAMSYIKEEKTLKANLLFIAMITVIYTTIFLIFDYYSPAISLGTRQGTGLAIGLLVIKQIANKCSVN